jgi:hypothetical protein
VSERRLLLAVAALAVAARLAYAFLGVDPQLTDDETHFWAIAGNVAAGDGYTYEGTPTAWRPPAYTVGLAGLRVLGFGVRGVQAVQAVLGAATPLLLSALAKRLGAPRWACLGAALVAAVYPPFVHIASQVLSENLALPLLVAALLLTVRLLDRPRLPVALACGAVWGLAVLARASALPAFAVAVAALALGRPRRPRLLAAGGVALAAVALVAPWSARNATAIGGLVPVVSNEAFTLWVSNRLDAVDLKDVFRDPAYPGLEDYGVHGREFPGIAALAAADGVDFAAASEARRDQWFRTRVAADVRADPVRFAARAAAKTLAVLAPAPANASRAERTGTAARLALWVTSGPVVALGLLGLAGLALRGGTAGRYLAGTAAVSLVGLATHLPYVRYRVGGVDPLLLVGAAWLVARGPRHREAAQLGGQLRQPDQGDQQQRGVPADAGGEHQRRRALADPEPAGREHRELPGQLPQRPGARDRGPAGTGVPTHGPVEHQRDEDP